VEMEMKTVLTAPYGTAYITIQKWYGSDLLYLTISAFEDGTLLFAQRAKVNRVDYTAGSGELFLFEERHVIRADVVTGEVAA